jgi:ribonucleoside-diphosphate reductase alpha chain
MTERKRLPRKRKSDTWSGRVNGHKVFVTTGEYPDGSLGEIFVDLHKVGAFSRGTLHCFAKLFSIALQYGVPLRVLVKTFRGVQFDPSGDVTGHESIKKAKSIIDYVMQVLACEYPDKCDKYEEENAL